MYMNPNYCILSLFDICLYKYLIKMFKVRLENTQNTLTSVESFLQSRKYLEFFILAGFFLPNLYQVRDGELQKVHYIL